MDAGGVLVARRRRGGGAGGAAAVSAGRATAVSAVATVGAEGVVAARRRRGGGAGGATVVSAVAFAGGDGVFAARRRRAGGERGATVVSAVAVAGADGVAAARRRRRGGAGGATVVSAVGVVAATAASAVAGRAARGAVAGVAARRTRRRGGAPAATRATVTAGPTGRERREGDARSGVGATNAGRRGVTGRSIIASKRDTRTAAGEEHTGCQGDDVDAADEDTAAVPTGKKVGAAVTAGRDGGHGSPRTPTPQAVSGGVVLAPMSQRWGDSRDQSAVRSASAAVWWIVVETLSRQQTGVGGGRWPAVPPQMSCCAEPEPLSAAGSGWQPERPKPPPPTPPEEPAPLVRWPPPLDGQEVLVGVWKCALA